MIEKTLFHLKKLSFPDFLRKIIFTIMRWFSFGIIRMIKAQFYFKTTSIFLGRNIRIHGLANMITVGKGTSFYDNCVFEFSPDAEVTIGEQVVFSYGVVFACRRKITVGNDVQVGEYSSIRDSTHRHDRTDVPMKYQQDIIDQIVIADNVWIGRNCLISPGSVIEEGVIVAAHSLVKGRLEKNGIYGGVPVKLIKYREAQEIK